VSFFFFVFFAPPHATRAPSFFAHATSTPTNHHNTHRALPSALPAWAASPARSICPHRLAALVGLADAQAAEEAAAGGAWERAEAEAAGGGEPALGSTQPSSPPSSPPAPTDWAWLALCAASGAAFTALALAARGALADARRWARARVLSPAPSLLEPLAPGEVAGAVTVVAANPAFAGAV
jgi:hypothetical protein